MIITIATILYLLALGGVCFSGYWAASTKGYSIILAITLFILSLTLMNAALNMFHASI